MNGIRRLAKLTRNVFGASKPSGPPSVQHEIIPWKGLEVAIRSNSVDLETIKWIETSLFFNVLSDTAFSPDDAILDLGAHIGPFALLAANQKSCRVFAFEPDSASLKLCIINSMLNSLEDRVVCHRLAVGGTRGTVSLYESTENWGHTTIPNGGLYNTLTGNSTEVECITLADAIAYTDRNRCAFLKFNTEGSEFDMIEKADIATLQRIAVMVGEIHFDLVSRSSDQMMRRLAEAGFSAELFPFDEHRSLLLARQNQ
jgi:FkbM family methyltransferase